MSIFRRRAREKESEETRPAASKPAAERTAAPPTEERRDRPPTFLPRRGARPRVESIFVRLVATGGIVGIGTAIGAVMGTQEADAWLIALVVAAVSVVLAAILWSSRSL